MHTQRRLKLLAFSGSERAGSLNARLLESGMAIARGAGAEVTHLRLKSHNIPLYDGDLESKEGLPAGVKAVRDLFIAHDGFLIASPEYNSGITPLLKNTIDWVSRSVAGDPPGILPAFYHKTAILFAASPGALGGLRGLYGLRFILENVGVTVCPDQLAVPSAHTQLVEGQPRLSDATMQSRLEAIIRRGMFIASQLCDIGRVIN